MASALVHAATVSPVGAAEIVRHFNVEETALIAVSVSGQTSAGARTGGTVGFVRQVDVREIPPVPSVTAMLGVDGVTDNSDAFPEVRTVRLRVLTVKICSSTSASR